METNHGPYQSFWHLSKEEALSQLTSNPNGLSNEEAEKRVKAYGPNTIKANSQGSAFLLFLSQF